MKNKTLTVVILILLVCSLGLNVFLIFGQKSDSRDEKNQFVGVYYSNSWNGKPATVILREDGTGVYPTGANMTWVYADDKLLFTLDDNSNSVYEAFPAESGISLWGVPFFKY